MLKKTLNNMDQDNRRKEAECAVVERHNEEKRDGLEKSEANVPDGKDVVKKPCVVSKKEMIAEGEKSADASDEVEKGKPAKSKVEEKFTPLAELAEELPATEDQSITTKCPECMHQMEIPMGESKACGECKEHYFLCFCLETLPIGAHGHIQCKNCGTERRFCSTCNAGWLVNTNSITIDHRCKKMHYICECDNFIEITPGQNVECNLCGLQHSPAVNVAF